MDEKPAGPIVVRWLNRAARFVVGVVVFAYALLDELLFPVFRPLIRWLGGLALFERLGRLIASSPPYAVLVMLATPFLLIEPAKVYALYLLATAHWLSGAGTMLAAQVLSLMICERIFHAGRGQLMKIGWFWASVRWLVGLRDAAFGWVSAMPLWQGAMAQVRRVRNWFRRLFSGGAEPN